MSVRLEYNEVCDSCVGSHMRKHNFDISNILFKLLRIFYMAQKYAARLTQDIFMYLFPHFLPVWKGNVLVIVLKLGCYNNEQTIFHHFAQNS
jgi:hypothetical protein